MVICASIFWFATVESPQAENNNIFIYLFFMSCRFFCEEKETKESIKCICTACCDPSAVASELNLDRSALSPCHQCLLFPSDLVHVYPSKMESILVCIMAMQAYLSFSFYQQHVYKSSPHGHLLIL